jgi:hypothetical protein
VKLRSSRSVRFFPLVLLGLVVGAGSSCVADPDDCGGGPTSDWPHRNQCADDGPTSETPAAGEDDSSDEEDRPASPTNDNEPRDPEKRDAGKAPAGAMDAGASKPAPPSSGSENDAADGGVPADAQVHDGGISGGLDGGSHGTDGGRSGTDGGSIGADGGAVVAPEPCTMDSDGRARGACFGIYCAATPEQLGRSLSSSGQCLAEGDLALVCDGELSRVVDECGQEHALALGFGSSVRACAREADSLTEASAGCVDCYVDELLCAVDNCLTPCLAGRASACTECRVSRCGAAFRSCSGLPRPSAL